MTPIRAASTCCKACDGVGEDEFALLTAFQRLVFFFRSKNRAWQELKWRYWWISTEIGRSKLFLNIARRPLTTQGDVNLSSWTFLELLACLAVQTSSKLPGRMPYWPCRHQEVRSTWSTPADDSYSSCFYLLQSMRRCRRRWVCVANSIPASCFYQKTVRDKNSNGDIGGFQLRLEELKTVTFYFWTLQEDRSPHKVTLTYLLEPFSSFLHVWPCVDIKWVPLMRAGGRYVNSILFQWEVPTCLTEFLCWYTPKLEVSTPCPKTKRTGEDGILKKQGTHIFQGKVWIVSALRISRQKPWIFRIETD